MEETENFWHSSHTQLQKENPAPGSDSLCGQCWRIFTCDSASTEQPQFHSTDTTLFTPPVQPTNQRIYQRQYQQVIESLVSHWQDHVLSLSDWCRNRLLLLTCPRHWSTFKHLNVPRVDFWSCWHYALFWFGSHLRRLFQLSDQFWRLKPCLCWVTTISFITCADDIKSCLDGNLAFSIDTYDSSPGNEAFERGAWWGGEQSGFYRWNLSAHLFIREALAVLR